ncbi:unnamed protein product [Heligmosomoides polygyrus]|uniref:Reverse transcriptase domain-containing protein n=1 Tax=Heligmosomoides polygyrus TaxID=6339 RepID=A0A183F5N5_HELPZ|nr:unnamed protein product [Heligmosomoides polygyrus]
MKIFEQIVDGQIREIVQLSSIQCGFVAGCGTVDAIYTARLLIEKHREKQKPVHIAFLDLKKAFARVPREVIWYALRRHGVLKSSQSGCEISTLVQRVEFNLQLEPRWSFTSLSEYTRVLRFPHSSLLS